MKIEIVSGEGTGPGKVEPFRGKKTSRAVYARLARERRDGERWAIAIVEGDRVTNRHQLQIALGEPVYPHWFDNRKGRNK